MSLSKISNSAKIKVSILISVTAVVLIIDQWTKFLIHTKFRWGESIPVLNSVFSLTYVRNSGAAFGLMHRAPVWFRDPFFIIVPVVALVVIVFILMSLPAAQKWAAIGLSLIFGGALGNLIDRLRFGYVIDFLDFYWRDAHWPAFNVADSCIVVGVGLMFLLSFFQEKQVSVSSPASQK